MEVGQKSLPEGEIREKKNRQFCCRELRRSRESEIYKLCRASWKSWLWTVARSFVRDCRRMPLKGKGLLMTRYLDVVVSLTVGVAIVKAFLHITVINLNEWLAVSSNLTRIIIYFDRMSFQRFYVFSLQVREIRKFLYFIFLHRIQNTNTYLCFNIFRSFMYSFAKDSFFFNSRFN